MQYIEKDGTLRRMSGGRKLPALLRKGENMKKNSIVLSVLAAGGLLFCAACNNDYVGKENSHPLFAKGVTLKSSQNYSKAREAFEGFLALCPKSARAHRELAEL